MHYHIAVVVAGTDKIVGVKDVPYVYEATAKVFALEVEQTMAAFGLEVVVLEGNSDYNCGRCKDPTVEVV